MTEQRNYGPGYRPVPEDVTRCVESVADGGRHVTVHQCWGLRGHGKDGLYCKLHAKEHPVNEPETWYAVETFVARKIKPVQVTHSTDQFVWVVGYSKSRKESRRGKYAVYFRTKQEAVEFCLQQAEGELARAKEQIDQLTIEIEKWRGY